MSDPDYVELAGGLTVPGAAYRLISDLIGRDYSLRQEGEMLRIAGPNGSKPELSADEIAGIKRYKAHLLAMIAYRAPERTW